MRLVRPYIPIRVRLEVIARQVQLRDVLQAAVHFRKASEQLKYLLWSKFGSRPYDLDHQPCLALRYFDEATGKYQPDACDPGFLIYRERDHHDIKTRIRGDHGEFSDLALIRREKKRRKKKTECTERQASRDQSEIGKQRFAVIGRGEAGQQARASSKDGAHASRALRSANRWPPKGSRPLRGRPF